MYDTKAKVKPPEPPKGSIKVGIFPSINSGLILFKIKFVICLSVKYEPKSEIACLSLPIKYS